MYISLCGVITCVQYTIFYYIDYVSTLSVIQLYLLYILYSVML